MHHDHKHAKINNLGQYPAVLFDDQENSGDELPGMYHTTTVYSTTSPAQSTKPLRVSLQIQGRNMVMELDTGSAVSIISENAYCDNLKTSDHQLRTYTGEVVRPIGVADVKDVHQDQTKTLPLYVLKGKVVNLFGREWLEHLHFNWPLLALSSAPFLQGTSSTSGT